MIEKWFKIILAKSCVHLFDVFQYHFSATKTVHDGNDFSSAILLKGVTCPQEAEFRAYDILLNLNEGDILR